MANPRKRGEEHGRVLSWQSGGGEFFNKARDSYRRGAKEPNSAQHHENPKGDDFFISDPRALTTVSEYFQSTEVSSLETPSETWGGDTVDGHMPAGPQHLVDKVFDV